MTHKTAGMKKAPKAPINADASFHDRSIGPIPTFAIRLKPWIKVHVASEGALTTLGLDAVIILLRIDVADFDLEGSLINLIGSNKPSQLLLV